MVYPKFETDYEEKMFKAELGYWGLEDGESEYSSQVSPHEVSKRINLKTFQYENAVEEPIEDDGPQVEEETPTQT